MPMPSRGARAARWIAIACVAAAVAHATALAWISDDAFVSFRYARNLVEGHGLVFNVGERVEGYTNPLWTLFVAAGLALGASAERWSLVGGIACYGASIAILAWAHARWAEAGANEDADAHADAHAPWRALPLAAIAGAAMPDWAAFATSGLETSLFTLLLLAAFVVVTDARGSATKRAVAAGALLALATLTRHDGAIVAVVVGAFVLVRRGTREAASFAGTFAAVWVPFTAWRVAYYGALLPNTYYAKSGGVAWWSQGLAYAGLFFARYWVLALALPLGLVALRRGARALGEVAWLAAACALAYGVYVVRVGGDFMFARLLVPVAPMLLVLLDVALLAARSAAERAGLAAVSVVALVATPSPVAGEKEIRGVLDERAHYSPERAARTDQRARTIAPFLAGTNAVVAIYGDEARLAYEGRIPVAIEAHTGLTDSFVAHQPLAARGRVGHEKLAPLDYLIRVRAADMTFSKVPTLLLGLDDYVPPVHAMLGDVRARLLTWDPPLVATLRARGAVVDDFLAWLDARIAALPAMSDAEAARELARCRRFYFEHVPDPEREAAFTRRLGASSHTP